jgi:hypothetical protein
MVRMNCTGLAVVRPTRRREKLGQTKNGLMELPPAGRAFACSMANLTDYPVEVQTGRVFGLVETVYSYPICTVSASVTETTPTWQEIVRSRASHLQSNEVQGHIQVLEGHDSMWSDRLGQIQAVEHHIPTNGQPISSQPYRAVPQSRELIDAEIQRMLKIDVIEAATSPWSSPIVLIPKPDGSIRVCIDYLIGSTYRCHVSDTYNITMYLIRGCYTFDCHIINHVSGFYVPSIHVTHILIRADPVHATFPNAISICDGISPTTHHSLLRARKISCHNSRTLA